MKKIVSEIFGISLVVFILVFLALTWKQDIVAAPPESTETLTKLEKQLWKHEGFRSKVYLDPAGTNFVVGVGRNIQDKGLCKDEALYLLRNDIQECTEDLYDIFDNFGDLNEDRRFVLIDMRFNLGPGGFREFKDMIQAVKDGDYILAAHEMMDSEWYSQVGIRAKRLRDMMLGVK